MSTKLDAQASNTKLNRLTHPERFLSILQEEPLSDEAMELMRRRKARRQLNRNRRDKDILEISTWFAILVFLVAAIKFGGPILFIIFNKAALP